MGRPLRWCPNAATYLRETFSSKGKLKIALLAAALTWVGLPLAPVTATYAVKVQVGTVSIRVAKEAVDEKSKQSNDCSKAVAKERGEANGAAGASEQPATSELPRDSVTFSSLEEHRWGCESPSLRQFRNAQCIQRGAFLTPQTRKSPT